MIRPVRSALRVRPLLVVALLLGPGCRSAPPPPTRIVGTKLFEDVFDKVRTAAVDVMDAQELYRRAAEGMVEELDDPYAVLLQPGQPPPPPDDRPVAPGVFLDRRDGGIVIVATVPGSAADSAGLRAGDRVLGIDSSSVDPERLDRVPALLIGKSGGAVTLRIRRAGVRAPLDVSVPRRAETQTALVTAELLGGGVARLRVGRFTAGVADSVRVAMEELRGKGARSVVLDLRETVGGTLEQGVSVADLFLDAGRTIVEAKGRAANASASLWDPLESTCRHASLSIL